MSKTLRRTVALLLSIMLMITAIPFTVYADDDETIDTAFDGYPEATWNVD